MVAPGTLVAARDRDDLVNVARDGDPDQVVAAHGAVGRIEREPTGTGYVDFGPGVGRTRQLGPGRVDVARRHVEISRPQPTTEAEAARGFGQQLGEVPARAPAAAQRLPWRLGSCLVT